MNLTADISSVLSLREVRKSFGGKAAVQGVSFDVHRGDIVGFLGPNGAGKTTVMSMVAGLQNPDAGEIRLFGTSKGARLKDVRARLGYLQEKPRIYPEMSARAYLEFFAELYGVKTPSSRADEVLDLVGLGDVSSRPMSKFSRGMQQRVCLARVLLHKPEFLMLDEPMLGLDPHGVAQMRDIFAGLNARGVTLLFSSHQLAEMERICDRVVLMENGRVIAAGRQDELLPDGGRRNAFVVEVAEGARLKADAVARLPGIASATTSRAGQVLVVPDMPKGCSSVEMRAAVSRILTASGHTVLSISKSDTSLEDLFLLMTTNTQIERTKGKIWT